jgi:hypothetical protein
VSVPKILTLFTEFVYSQPIVGIPQGTAPSILNRSFTITADVEVPAGGEEGMLATTGGRFGGWGFYLLKGKPVFVYNLLDLNRERIEGGQPLSAGKHTVSIDFKYDGPGLGKGGTAVLLVDGAEVAAAALAVTVGLKTNPCGPPSYFAIVLPTSKGVVDAADARHKKLFSDSGPAGPCSAVRSSNGTPCRFL